MTCSYLEPYASEYVAAENFVTVSIIFSTAFASKNERSTIRLLPEIKSSALARRAFSRTSEGLIRWDTLHFHIISTSIVLIFRFPSHGQVGVTGFSNSSLGGWETFLWFFTSSWWVYIILLLFCYLKCIGLLLRVSGILICIGVI